MQNIQPQGDNDIAFVERELRILVSIAARYTLTDWCESQRYRRKFACRLIAISKFETTLFAPVSGKVGDRVITSCDEFGILDGSITRILERGFVVRIAATESGRRKLAARIEGYEKIKNYDLVDRRSHKRIIPINPSSTLFFGDGTQMDCFVIDISTSGVAVSANAQPEIGTPLAIGSLVGRVVRHFDDGFAIKFIREEDIDDLEQKLVAPAA